MASVKEIRYSSSVVSIGSIPLGGSHPVRIQSMTNTNTLDTASSVLQCIKLIEAGADFVRLTTQGIKEAENLAVIKNELRRAGYNTPLIADVHFNPAVAEVAAAIVEKVRINPGNYTDKRASFLKAELTTKEYDEELERIHSRLLPLINICRQHSTVLRIGVNHGSLSDRIMTRYGNTPTGMAWSAIEFIRILKAENFSNLVLSMKSSDTSVMIESTRLLVKMMTEEKVAFPIHLGVTEAGEGEDGRVRSAAGIGTLLSEGIGDTIRVSLSEDPFLEIPVARKLVEFLPRNIIAEMPAERKTNGVFPQKPVEFRSTSGPLVMADFSAYRDFTAAQYIEAGFTEGSSPGTVQSSNNSADLIFAADYPGQVPPAVRLVLPYRLWLKKKSQENIFPLFSPRLWNETTERSEVMNFILAGKETPVEEFINITGESVMVLFRCDPAKEMYAADRFITDLSAINEALQVILNPEFNESNIEDLMIKASAFTGRFINSKTISGICITNRAGLSAESVTRLAFSILQNTGTRITRTQYISCPTCGRTKFNLPEAVKKVKEATAHLKGLKIAVMGCIVNGPGEMAGADWGYVGAGEGKVNIYKGTEVVLKNVPEDEAIDKFLKLIEDN